MHPFRQLALMKNSRIQATCDRIPSSCTCEESSPITRSLILHLLPLELMASAYLLNPLPKDRCNFEVLYWCLMRLHQSCYYGICWRYWTQCWMLEYLARKVAWGLCWACATAWTACLSLSFETLNHLFEEPIISTDSSCLWEGLRIPADPDYTFWEKDE